jgi:hypothetical protein
VAVGSGTSELIPAHAEERNENEAGLAHIDPTQLWGGLRRNGTGYTA